MPRTPGIPLDYSPGIIPGLENHLSEVLLGILTTPVALLGKTRPLGFYRPREFSERPYLYHPVPKVYMRYAFKRQNTLYFAVFLSENSYFSQCLAGNHIRTKPVVKSVCVCARHIVKRQNYPQCSCVFREQFYCRRHLCYFSREQFLSALHREKA